VDHLGPVEAVDRLRECVVVGVADTVDRGMHAGRGEAFGGADQDVLDASAAVVNPAVGSAGSTRLERWLQGIEHEARVCRPARPPADEAAGVGVDGEAA
jgi:hypothetical protein